MPGIEQSSLFFLSNILIMKQKNFSENSSDTQLMNHLGNALTGGAWSIVLWVGKVWVKLNAMLLMVFLRKKIGAKMFSFGLWFWLGAWMLILIIISTENWASLVHAGATEGHRYSMPLLSWHGQIFVWLMVIKWIIANIALRHPHSKWYRHRYSIGDSIIYPLLRWTLKPLGIIDRETAPKTFWKLNEARWMQLWEPLILFFIARHLHQIGYGVYGNFLMIATCCYAYYTYQAFTNTAEPGQALGEANSTQHAMHHPAAKKEDTSPVITE